ncbi:hypothetical protein [Cellulomonas sp. ATA003]|uniref:hypothetical protein n=1 Tax=Cellulomonas sp. ATA003 TaxID=3073064 RepID=UPI002873C495|nr:hypothetical protein [Cellulomonas sp. ATA003]WNB87110.1 hypothetical protein REH70_08315 [Cellulomonas sp. ATA003]
MPVMLRPGERLEVRGRAVTVTPTAFACLPPVRDRLVEAAVAGETVTYGELREELGLRYLVQGMGRLLDLLTEDCARRGEPSLASLVVNAATGEVGRNGAGDAAAERERVVAHHRAVRHYT